MLREGVEYRFDYKQGGSRKVLEKRKIPNCLWEGDFRQGADKSTRHC